MIPKEVEDALKKLHSEASRPYRTIDSEECHAQFNIIKNYLETSDRYIHDLEQHVDDLAASSK